MPYDYTIVDAFTHDAFHGNPAAVFLLDAPRSTEWMRQVASEMHLSETAFVVREAVDEIGPIFRLRWFTPTAEVKLCGHATLATAHVLWEREVLPAQDQARFLTLSGLLTASPGDAGWITLNFPARPGQPCPPPTGIAAALGQVPVGTWISAEDLLVELPNAQAVRTLTPDIGALRTVPVRGVCVTAIADSPGVDFVSRFFAPNVGVDEDPVTGSAHTVLAPFWAARLQDRPGSSAGPLPVDHELIGHQVSPRGGFVRTRLQGDRVLLSGEALTVACGTLVVEDNG